MSSGRDVRTQTAIAVVVTTGVIASIATTQPHLFHPRIRAELIDQTLSFVPEHETTVVLFEASLDTSEPLLHDPGLEDGQTGLFVRVYTKDGAQGGKDGAPLLSPMLASLRREGEAHASLEAARERTLVSSSDTAILDEAIDSVYLGLGARIVPGCGKHCTSVERFELRVSTLEAIPSATTLSFYATAVAIYDLDPSRDPPEKDQIALRIVEMRHEGGPAPRRSDRADGGVDAGVPDVPSVDTGTSDVDDVDAHARDVSAPDASVGDTGFRD